MRGREAVPSQHRHTYLLARIKRDAPDVAARISESSGVRAAAAAQ